MRRHPAPLCVECVCVRAKKGIGTQKQSQRQDTTFEARGCALTCRHTRRRCLAPIVHACHWQCSLRARALGGSMRLLIAIAPTRSLKKGKALQSGSSFSVCGSQVTSHPGTAFCAGSRDGEPTASERQHQLQSIAAVRSRSAGMHGAHGRDSRTRKVRTQGTQRGDRRAAYASAVGELLRKLDERTNGSELGKGGTFGRPSGGGDGSRQYASTLGP